MNYSLGNTLSRGGALNPDGLSLDLQFATDKSLVARRGPTPTFTRASTATFVGSNGLIQSAAINDARFDHDPVTLACKGLLIEESRTNLVNHSQDFTQAFWGKDACSVSSVSGTSPSGEITVQKLVEDTSTAGHGLSWFVGTTGIQTLSLFAKADGRQWLRLNPLLIGNVWFDLQNGVLGTVSAGLVASITNYGNGWYRCAVTATSATTSSALVRIATANNNVTYTGDGTSGILIWGTQLEAGAFPTSYIPTTTASVVRSQDLCSIASIASFYGNGVGTILAGSQFNGASLLNGVCGFFTGTNQVVISRLVNNTRAATNGNAPNLSINSGTLASTLFVKSAFAFNTNDGSFANNGVSAGTSASVGIPSVSFFGIGTNGSQPMQSGTISEIKVFKKRLANAKLLTITV